MSSKRIKNEMGVAAKIREKKKREALTNSIAGSMLRYVKRSKPSTPDESVEENNKSSKEATGFDHDQAENSDEHSNEHEFHENENEELKLFLKHGDRSDIDGKELFMELKLLRGNLPTNIQKAAEILDFLKKAETCYPNTWTAYRIMMTIPVSVVSAERSFSKLKLIKSYLRSSMSQERLNGLAIISIERKMAKNLDYTSLMNEFANKTARRIIFEE